MHTASCAVSSAWGSEGADVFLESLEIDHAFGENSIDERTRTAQKLGGPLHRWRRGRTGRRGVDRGLRFPNLCALFVKLASGQLGEAATSVCHKRELHAEREVGERLELMVADWYDLLALFPAVAEQRRIVADQDNHGDAVAELRQHLLDEPCVISWKRTLISANGPLRGGRSRASASLRCVYGLGSFIES